MGHPPRARLASKICTGDIMKDWILLFRWSWRDLRKYWVKVIAIALVIGIGTGAYAGLTSTVDWRRESNVASVELLNMYDARFQLAGDSSVQAGQLEAAARRAGARGPRARRRRLQGVGRRRRLRGGRRRGARLEDSGA